MNILVTTLGTSWAIVPELIGFTNIETFKLFNNHPQKFYLKEKNIQPIDEIYIITTDSQRTKQATEKIQEWVHLSQIDIKAYFIVSEGIDDMSNIEECKRVGELIYKTVLTAHKNAKNGKVYLSLAGGRKTMSADMQDAAYFFGCDALLHIAISKDETNRKLSVLQKTEDWINPLHRKIAENIIPIIISDKIEPSYITQTFEDIENNIIDIKKEKHKTAFEFYDKLHNLRKQASSLLVNYISQLSNAQTGNFRLLYATSPNKLRSLQNKTIANNPENKDGDLQWLKTLPKAELHCHMGGILTPEEIIETAEAILSTKAAKQYLKTKECQQLIKETEYAIKSGAVHGLSSPKEIISQFRDIPQPYCIATFVSRFRENVDMLYEYIYGEREVNPDLWFARGIEHYEKLGDLQGSSLLQTEEAIRSACRILKRKCRKDNVKYLELRCSPANYTKGGLNSRKVVDIIIDELKKDKNCYYSLIFIASRHGDLERIEEHVNLAKSILLEDSSRRDWLVGFDLAGAETAKSPEKFRELFLPLMEECLNLTIHAGEGENVENIWKAVYHLNADRIGHGLTLKDKPELMKRFIDRRIAIEMCPSSNFQIVGFKDYSIKETYRLQDYPLKYYLTQGIYITINTDDPGISLTNLTQEYYKAASMSENGLSKWDIIRIIRNGFRFAFAPYEIRRKLLIEAEREIMDIVVEG